MNTIVGKWQGGVVASFFFFILCYHLVFSNSPGYAHLILICIWFWFFYTTLTDHAHTWGRLIKNNNMHFSLSLSFLLFHLCPQDPSANVPVQRSRRLPQEVAAYMAQELNIEEYEACILIFLYNKTRVVFNYCCFLTTL